MRRSRYTVGGVESGDALTEATIAEVKVTSVGRKIDQTYKRGNSVPCVSYARYCHDYFFVVRASLISRSSTCFGAGLHSGSSGSYSRVIENDCRSVQRRFRWHSPSRRCLGSPTPSGSLPYLVGRIHLHKRCKHWKSVNCKATYWQGEQHTRSPIGAGKMALQPFEKTSCGVSLCQRQTACVGWQNGVCTMWCDDHTVCIREEQKYQDTELNGTTQSRFKS
ncbi:hypothetical protein BGZ57DRAFT_899777 [Hyaloscypha finlandica]|nr:hypothetical protein BGZ57DRAFT_899777 [Hyaloscypha finlandica]